MDWYNRQMYEIIAKIGKSEFTVSTRFSKKILHSEIQTEMTNYPICNYTLK